MNNLQNTEANIDFQNELTIVELEDRNEMAAVAAARCCGICISAAE